MIGADLGEIDARQRRHHLIMAQPGQCGDGDDLVARRLQPRDDRRQRGHRLGAVAAAIVQQDDVGAAVRRAGLHRLQRVIDDGGDAGGLPVAGIDVQPDHRIAHLLADEGGDQLVAGGRLGIAKVGHAHQADRMACVGLYQPPRHVQLNIGAEARFLAHVGVGIGVVADLVAVGHHAFQQGPVRDAVLADDEKGGGDVELFEDREDLRGVFVVRPIVEGQRDHLGLVSGALHHEGGGEREILLG